MAVGNSASTIAASTSLLYADTATTGTYTLSLHDALPISAEEAAARDHFVPGGELRHQRLMLAGRRDRKSTRLNSSHVEISYAVFCLKKKTTTTDRPRANRDKYTVS